ncbi:hypothetical protein GCM10027065_06530 [Rhodanobacter koreensis]
MGHDHLFGLGIGVRVGGMGGQRQHERAEGNGGKQAHGKLRHKGETESAEYAIDVSVAACAEYVQAISRFSVADRTRL